MASNPGKKPESLKTKIEDLKKENEELKVFIEDLKTVEKWSQTQLQDKLEEVTRTKAEIEKTRDYVENVISVMGDALVVLDPNGRIEKINQATVGLFGYEKDELIGEGLDIIFENDFAALIGPTMKELLKKGSIKNRETIATSKSGEKIPVDFSGSVMLSKQGRLIGIVGVARDKREIKRIMQKEKRLATIAGEVEAEYKRAEELEKAFQKRKELEHIINNGPAVAFLWRAVEGWPVGFVSDNIRQFGYIPEKFYFKRIPFSSMVHPEDWKRITAEVEQHKKERRDIFIREYRLLTKDGKERWINEHAWARRDFNDDITHYQGILLDITERKKAEQDLRKAYDRLKETQMQLIQSAKMAAVGQLAGGIAHEVKNPLGVILQAANCLERYVGSDMQKQSEVLNMIKNAVKRADKIVHGLLDFSRVSPLELKPCDINEVFKSSLVLVEKQLVVHNVKINEDFAEALPPAIIDKNQITQVFINIILNASQAMSEGGELFLKTYLNKTPEEGIVCEVEDTGPGITEENLSRIFDPFFTTKPPGKGTGLGLSITNSIVLRHKGSIDVKSETGKGTKFIITLPARKRGEKDG